MQAHVIGEKVRVNGKRGVITKLDANGKIWIKYVDPIDVETYGNGDILVKNSIQLVKNDIFISPAKSTWIRPERREFVEWIKKIFAVESKKRNSNMMELFKQQKFAREYLQLESPYRGLLLYYGLGSGKTCAAVAVCENLKEDKPIVVILPASLKPNFVENGLKKCGSLVYKKDPLTIAKYYKFISLNSRNALKSLMELGNLDNCVIVVDEAHNLISKIISGFKGISKQGKGIYDLLMNAKNCKIVFLSGIPLINSIFEVGVICNILKGYIELHVFDIMKISGIPDKNTNLAQLKTNLSELKFMEYLEIGRESGVIELTISPRSYDKDFDECIQMIIKAAKSANVDIQYKLLNRLPTFPETEEEFDSYFIKDKNTENESLVNKSMLSRRMLGTVSYYKNEDDKDYPELRKTEIISVPMSNYQYSIYEIARNKERALERQSAKKKKQKSANEDLGKSYFRLLSRMVGNYAFPKKYARYDFITFEDEEKESSEKKEDKKEKEARILRSMKTHSNEYFTLDALTENSPKMKIIMEMILNIEGLVLLYTTFVSIEGIKLFSYILEQNGFSKYSKGTKAGQHYALFTGKEKDKEKEEAITTFNLPENKNGELIKVLLISSSGAEGLDLKNVRNVFIMEPHWNEARINQVIGRARRKKSHMDLPPNKRYVNVYRFHMTFTNEQKEDSPEPLTSDEYIYMIAQKKERITRETLDIMKFVAVDCEMNKVENNMKECFTFGKGATGLSYLPKIKDDELYGEMIQTKKQIKKLVKGGITADNHVIIIDSAKKKIYMATNSDMLAPITNVKSIVRKIYVDPVGREVYERVKGRDPVMIGTINELSQFVQN